MANIVVVFPKPDDARNIRNLLVRNGYSVTAVCTSGMAALQAADNLNEGIVVCGYKYPDMLYNQLYESLPRTFAMLLMASERVISEGIPEGIISVCMPLKVHDLMDTLELLSDEVERQRRKRKSMPRRKNEEEQKQIKEAKELLMERNQMSEEEAHRYLQKTSMDSGTNIVETAQMILSLMSA
ncbi:MAG: ANTAR domain-containing protein [Lachnospiraceae bacterium]|nr:ANTAR domain-containing protein [Lachnospiraceae bacterium]